MKLILAGALTMGFVIAGLFFLRFWRQTRDRLFALFALSFFVMGLNRLILSILWINSPDGVRGPWHDRMSWVRLVAFLLILLAILDKNRSPGPSSSKRISE